MAPSNTSIIQADFNGHPLPFTSDGWFNATVAAATFGRRVDHWLKTQETRDYIAELCEISNSPQKGYLRTLRGNGGGTWLHPKLAVVFARWLNVRFAVWCDDQIDRIIRTQSVTPEYLPTYRSLHDRVGELAANSANSKFVHMNINKLVNKTVGIGPGERPVLPMAQRSLVVVAQNLAITAMNDCADHRDGYAKAKASLETLRTALEPPKAA